MDIFIACCSEMNLFLVSESQITLIHNIHSKETYLANHFNIGTNLIYGLMSIKGAAISN